jgi:hypothetical protein
VNFDFSPNILCELNIFCHISVIFTSAKISHFAVINISQKKSAESDEDVNRLQVMQHAHYPIGEHVTTPVTYKYPQSVRCSTDTQTHRTPNMSYTALLFLTLVFVAAKGLFLQNSQSCK